MTFKRLKEKINLDPKNKTRSRSFIGRMPQLLTYMCCRWSVVCCCSLVGRWWHLKASKRNKSCSQKKTRSRSIIRPRLQLLTYVYYRWSVVCCCSLVGRWWHLKASKRNKSCSQKKLDRDLLLDQGSNCWRRSVVVGRSSVVVRWSVVFYCSLVGRWWHLKASKKNKSCSQK